MVVEAYDLLMGDTTLDFVKGEHVVIYGGGETGCEAAEFVAATGATVTLVSRSRADQLARSAEAVYRINLIGRLNHHARITVLERHHVTAVGEGMVEVSGESRAPYSIAASRLLLAQGRDSDDDLLAPLLRAGIACHVIGDSRKGGRIGDAVRDGYEAMRAIVARYGTVQPALC
ncbi:FAD-dependent oxidoreductase [Sphingobium sp. AS12]|uniref:FAD-dependent oxidoreductase n=1 Tax=Sphingobium sp. AS12 TaxID=2849495 RepID=UPI0020C8FC57|nr:FAD-dependent oxidoreductase [Sphingobium sp. AS12]